MADELHLLRKLNVYSTRGWPAMVRPGGFGDVEAGEFEDLQSFIAHASAQGYEPHIPDEVYAQMVSVGAAPEDRPLGLRR